MMNKIIKKLVGVLLAIVGYMVAYEIIMHFTCVY